MGIVDYFKDNIELEESLEKCNTKKEKIETVLKSKYVENLNRDILIFNKEVPYEEQVNKDNKEFEINVNFKISLALREKVTANIPYRPFHGHNYIEMIYVYEGSYSQIIDGEIITLNVGDCCLLNKNVKHKDFPITSEDIVLFFSFSNDFIGDQLKNYIDNNEVLKNFFYKKDVDGKRKERYILFKNGEYEGANGVIKNVVGEYFNQDIGSSYIIIGHTVRLFQLLTYGSYEKDIVSFAKSKGNDLFTRIEKYIEENISDITREKLAEELHYNPNYLNTIIKKNTNLSYSDYVISKRLEITIRLLKNSDHSINRIIKEVGYINKSYFYKIFVSRYGIKPKEFREIFRVKE